MSRFGKLEFEPAQTGHAHAATERGEGHWLTEANAAFARAEFEPALRFFARVLEYNPDCVAAWTGQIRALVELGEFREARRWADKALERFPVAPELLAAKAVTLGRLGELEEAITFSDASLGEHGDTPYVWLSRADVLLARGEKRADHCFEQAMTRAAGDWLITWLAARIRQFHRQFAAALKLVREALVIAPGETVLWILSGQCQLELGLTEAARVSFTQARQLNPASAAATEGLRALDRQSPITRLAGKLRQLFRA